ncbi:hypothetical protein B4U84_00300 [Westiellopsis prolifica IICB1]|nr:hypothetical protein B4U84_00300 [Westiellopsis prolifica IICB1]
MIFGQPILDLRFWIHPNHNRQLILDFGLNNLLIQNSVIPFHKKSDTNTDPVPDAIYRVWYKIYVYRD